MNLDGPCEANPQSDSVIDDGVHKAGADALVLPGHGVGENEGRGGEAHVHAERHDDHGYKSLAPV